MRWRWLAWVSLILNGVLLATWGWAPRRSSAKAPVSLTSEVLGAEASQKTNVVVRRQFFSWREVESPDYATYIANLRDIGCPEQTIRDIIIADINSLYARRRANELVGSEQQWWRSEPDPAVVQAAAAKSRELDGERIELLTRLLGTNWEAGDIINLPRPTKPGLILDGPVLGMLPAETKQALQEISLRSEDRLKAYTDELRRTGQPVDLQEISRLRQQTRSELASYLTPQQLEEFLLRYSQNANNLRSQLGQLKYFDATPDEFRSMFRATDTFDQQLEALASATDANSVDQRKTLQEQRERALRLALGEKRYQEYRMLHDPVYRDAVAEARESGNPQLSDSIYQVKEAALAESARIQNDESLSEDQKKLQLKQTELDQLAANIALKNPELPPQPPEPQANPPRRTHLVRPGDTVAVVALMYGLPESAIRAANPRLNLNRLQAGDSLVIPPSSLPNFTP